MIKKPYKYEVKQRKGSKVTSTSASQTIYGRRWKERRLLSSESEHLILISKKPNNYGLVIVRIKEEGQPMERDSFYIDKKDVIPLTKDAEKRLK